MKIRYRGGQLDGHSFEGSRRQPQHRDSDGIPIPRAAGINRILATVRLGATPDVYCYDQRAGGYIHISVLIGRCAVLAERLAA